MTTKIYSHPDIFLHDQLAHHVVMKNNRIESVYSAIVDVCGIEIVNAKPAPLSFFELFHDRAYLDHLQNNAPKNDNDRYALDDETIMNRYTLPALQLSVGAIKMAIDDIYTDQIINAFCPVYAGHHALPELGMGFCFTNAIAIGAKYAAQLGYQHIAVVDFDTHSGNGTVIGLKDDLRFLFAETYQMGFPGRPLMRHEHPSNVHRIETDQDQYARASWKSAWQEVLLPKIKAFQPEIILISAGFDAHRNDPLGMTYLEDEDYVWITGELVSIQPRIVSVLEGGYSLLDTARCARLHVKSLVDGGKSAIV